jgi:predicted amidohydrolase
MPTFTLAMAQMLVEDGERDRNLARACEMIARAAAEGCAAVVLPEALDVGWTHPSAREMAETIPGPSSDRLASAASDAGVYVVAGLTERDAPRVYNAAILISPRGEILLRHRKINILDIARDTYAIGDSLSVAETELGCIAIPICADNFPSSLVLGHSLGRMGAQMILSPCAWAMPADHDNEAEPYGEMWRTAYSELARAHDMHVIGVSNVGWIEGGPWNGRKCIGCSLAMAPGGEVIAQGPYGVDADELMVVEVTTAMRAGPAGAAGGCESSRR